MLIAMRWSRWVLVRLLALPRSGSPPVPSMTRPSSRSLTRAPAPVRRGGHRGEAVAFLDAQLVEAAGRGGTLGQRGGDEQYREFVDHARGEGGSTSMPLSAEWRTRKSRDRLAADFARVQLLDASAHLAQHLEQPRARRVEADVLDRQLAARHDQRGDGEERSRRRIARYFDLLRLEVGLAAQADHAFTILLLDPQLGAEALSMRSVWSRVGTGSITLVIPAVLSPASSTALFTCALATGRR